MNTTKIELELAMLPTVELAYMVEHCTAQRDSAAQDYPALADVWNAIMGALADEQERRRGFRPEALLAPDTPDFDCAWTGDKAGV